jgi:hypothetical protein
MVVLRVSRRQRTCTAVIEAQAWSFDNPTDRTLNLRTSVRYHRHFKGIIESWFVNDAR